MGLLRQVGWSNGDLSFLLDCIASPLIFVGIDIVSDVGKCSSAREILAVIYALCISLVTY